MAQHITVTQSDGTVTEITVSDPTIAREYESLPFQADHIASVTVTVTDD
ncbi:hypothetical protein [Streptomyces sp. NPDC058495]